MQQNHIIGKDALLIVAKDPVSRQTRDLEVHVLQMCAL